MASGAMGMNLSTVCHRIRRQGPWQRLHPGVVLTHSGTATDRELHLAALAYAGDGALLTGMSGLRLIGVRAAASHRDRHVLVSHQRRKQSRPGVVVERTRNLPTPVVRQGLPIAPVARCTIDAARQLADRSAVRELVAEVVQRRLCTVTELTDALAAAANQRSALPREVLGEVEAGVRSVAEAHAREVFGRHGIAQPRWNWALYTVDGEHVVTPDGWWEEIGCALQIDSMRYHLGPRLYRRTQQLQRALARYDVPFLPIAPSDILEDEHGFVAEVRAFLATHAAHLPTSALAARPPDAGPRRP
jgi:CheY-like chemotaxis protein